jgi:hypothetical protein
MNEGRRCIETEVVNPVSLDLTFCQERPLIQCFMCEAATAGLLPGKFLIKEDDLASCTSEICSPERTSRAASDYDNGIRTNHLLYCWFFKYLSNHSTVRRMESIRFSRFSKP